MINLKYLTTPFLFFILFATDSNCQNSGDITVTISDFEFSRKGQLITMIFESEDGFPSNLGKAVRSVKSRGDDIGKWVRTFGKLSFGEYAVVVYYDKNSNNKLDRNFFGSPKEPIGTSCNRKSGRLKFENASFKLDGQVKELKIKLY